MTIGAYAVAWWLTLILAALAVTGLLVTLWKLLAALRKAADWALDWLPVWQAFARWLVMTAWCRLRRQIPPPWISPAEADWDPGQEQNGLCAGCRDDSEHCDGAIDTCDCTCGWDEDWAERELPSREELGFTADQPTLEGVLWEPPQHWASGRCWCNKFHRDQVETIALTARSAGVLAHLDPQHERLQPAWEAEIASAMAWWEELPSGTAFTRAMAAHVRELASLAVPPSASQS